MVGRRRRHPLPPSTQRVGRACGPRLRAAPALRCPMLPDCADCAPLPPARLCQLCAPCPLPPAPCRLCRLCAPCPLPNCSRCGYSQLFMLALNCFICGYSQMKLLEAPHKQVSGRLLSRKRYKRELSTGAGKGFTAPWRASAVFSTSVCQHFLLCPWRAFQGANKHLLI